MFDIFVAGLSFVSFLSYRLLAFPVVPFRSLIAHRGIERTELHRVYILIV